MPICPIDGKFLMFLIMEIFSTRVDILRKCFYSGIFYRLAPESIPLLYYNIAADQREDNRYTRRNMGKSEVNFRFWSNRHRKKCAIDCTKWQNRKKTWNRFQVLNLSERKMSSRLYILNLSAPKMPSRLGILRPSARKSCTYWQGLTPCKPPTRKKPWIDSRSCYFVQPVAHFQ